MLWRSCIQHPQGYKVTLNTPLQLMYKQLMIKLYYIKSITIYYGLQYELKATIISIFLFNIIALVQNC